MSKPTTPVDKDLLIQAVNKAEEAGPLPNQSILWKKIADIYNASAKIPISFSVVMLRVKEWNIPFKTPAGRRGMAVMTEEHKRKLAEGRAAGGGKRDRGKKLKKNPKFQTCVNAMRTVAKENKAERHLPLIDKVAKGSLRAAIRYNCLVCTGFHISEIGKCSDLSCPFWLHRPNVDPNSGVEPELLPEDPLDSENEPEEDNGKMDVLGHFLSDD